MKLNLKYLSIIFLLFSMSLHAQYDFSLPDLFRTERNLPLVSLDTSMDVLISNYGAIPNDGKDDVEAIEKALVFAKKFSESGVKVRVVFDKGTYDLIYASTKTHMLELKEASNILIEGNGAEIIIHNPLIGFFSVINSKNVIIKNLFIDYDPLPFTQGKIIAVSEEVNSFDLKIDEGFPKLSHSMFQDANRVWGMLMDPEIPGKLKDGAPNLFGSKEFKEVSPRVFRIYFRGPRLLKYVETGDLYVHIARTNGRTIFRTGSSKNITYLNITSYTSPAGSYAAFNMEEWNVIGCKLMIKPGRLHSANADCFHINGGKFGPWIENSLFEGYSDDAINMKASRSYILKQESPTELLVKPAARKGDIIRIFNPREGKLIGKYNVIENKFIKGAGMLITLDKSIEQELNIGETKKNDLIYNDSKSNESFVIRNNTFRNARRYGILIQNSNGMIERNLFENLSQSAITLNNGVDWGEGFIAHDIVINQNIFKNCGYDAKYLKMENAAAIRMRVNKLKDLDSKTKWNGVAKADWQGLENITVTNNTFLYNKRALAVECTKNSFIKNNKFIRNVKDLSNEYEIILKTNNSNLTFEN